MKNCFACKTEKPKSEFHNSKGRKDGKNPYCKLCTSIKSKERNKIKASLRPDKELSPRQLAKLNMETHYTPNSPCSKCETSKRLVSTHQCCKCLSIRRVDIASEKTKVRSRELKLIFVKKRTARNLGFNKYKTGLPCKYGHTSYKLLSTNQCIECLNERNRNSERTNGKYNKSDKEKAKRRSRAGRVKNRKYYRNVLIKNPEFKMTAFMRSCVRRLFITKTQTSSEVLGYNKHDLMSNLESLFTDGMTWSNYGDWHIDHIKSIKSFLDEGVTDPKIINALSNLQPLWAFDNLSKGSK